MATFKIGGKDYEVEPLTFGQIKRTWAHVQKMVTPDGKFRDIEEGVAAGFEAVEAACAVAAEVLKKQHPDITPEFIQENIRPNEIPAMSAAIEQLMVESGLAARPQARPAGQEPQAAESPGTAIGTDSSQSSSPPAAKPEAGAE